MKKSISIDEIENKASLFLIEFNIHEPFVPIEQIVKGNNINLMPYDFDDEISGVLVIKDNIATIGYNKANSKERIRFTIAHEFAHHTLHWKPQAKSNQEVFVDKDLFMKFRNTLNEYNQEEVRIEQQANAFAAAILMPKHFIEKELNKVEYQKLKETNIIQKLASKFKVSEPAMTYRLANLQMFY
ncbi:ImmA/IrrE family metallo-endopeptidase [Pedobacter sp. Leaf250]|uniref:ImmA/IrrE family metallo-endopeptidase n=1 Tax=Pedobacter sp. Leaf250 TaxID=2876559 RepID=UPI001E463995|nr:ImmA/IrrE family metallo-endopeptidase [Pedobacter sp. Leaf250]